MIATIDPANRVPWEATLPMLVTGGGGTVDLSSLSFTDVYRVSALVDAARRVRPPRSLTIRHPPATVRKIPCLLWPDEAVRLIGDDSRSP
ncbi:hypothetical protein [Amycolatopsis sp. cmx-11-12]|uniref:hypothetical protein n=1 Tax=Amycolatopsis sp. cmx-11-12 TaxID=2785795 RepID=UPI0039181C9D